ncbi:MAG: hypothetical protein AABZ55_14390, partial [Bdellovibrionota bacterium]
MSRPRERKWLGIVTALYGVSTLVAMAPMSLGAALLGGSVFYLWFSDSSFRNHAKNLISTPEFKKYIRISALFLTACVLSLVGAAFFPIGINGVKPQVSFISDFSKSWYFLWPIVIALALKSISPQERKTALRAWFIAFGILSFVGIVQHFVGWPRPQRIPGNDSRYHATLFLGHHLSVASIWIFPFFAALDLLRKKDRLGFSKNTLRTLVLFGGATLFLTYSRALWVAMVPGILIWCWLSYPKKWAGGATILILIAALTATQIPS